MVNFDETTDIESVHDAKADDMIHDDEKLEINPLQHKTVFFLTNYPRHGQLE